MNSPNLFDLSSVFSAVASAVADQEMLVWRERRLTYGEVHRRVDALAAYLRTVGPGCHTERKHLARHESGRSEAVAIVALTAEKFVTDDELIDTCRGIIADYKIPKAFIHAPMIVRSPAGKADYRWAAAVAAAHT